MPHVLSMRYFVTGSAGFIGFHLCRRLLADGHVVDGFDAMTPYYDPALKERRLALLARANGFRNTVAHLEDMPALDRAFRAAAPDVVIHLAAQAGVRYSLENPRAYVESNVIGTFNLMECARETPPRHLLMASTSSVYGASAQTPFHETNPTDRPITLYAATKKATELMGHSYAHLWRLPTTMFRFFTVYGPWGRPDMAPLKFLEAIEAGRPIDVYNHGDMRRDFTYIDDLVEAVVRLADCVPVPGEKVCNSDTASPDGPFRVVNIGRGAPAHLMDFIAELERATGKPAKRNYLPMQKGDVPITFANCDLLEKLTGYRPATGIAAGVDALVDWSRAMKAGTPV